MSWRKGLKESPMLPILLGGTAALFVMEVSFMLALSKYRIERIAKAPSGPIMATIEDLGLIKESANPPLVRRSAAAEGR
jgi:hypothetical protein